MRLSDGDIEQRLADGSIVIEPAPASDDIAGISVDLAPRPPLPGV